MSGHQTHDPTTGLLMELLKATVLVKGAGSGKVVIPFEHYGRAVAEYDLSIKIDKANKQFVVSLQDMPPERKTRLILPDEMGPLLGK